ncbi:MAG: NAD-dependent epimerase/dehydratase family protein [Acidimicrobiales bacterium]
MNEQKRLHVVLGTGPLGLAVARHLAARGDRVRVANRGGRADLPEGVEVVAANVAEAGGARRACDGAAVIYHCANPPYARWPELHPPLMRAIIEGSSSAGATLVFGDNLYAYGPVDGPLTEDLPYRAQGPNGRTRARIADDLMAAHEDGRVRASIGRGSDFFGPHAHQSTAGDRVFARAVAGKPAQVLGDPDAAHTVTYLEDFARALVTWGSGRRRWARSGTSRTPRRSRPGDSWRWSSPSWAVRRVFGRRPGGAWSWRAYSIRPSGR